MTHALMATQDGWIYRPFPRQREFHNSPAKYRLFGGAAGPGKTKALLWEAIRQAAMLPNVETLLMRRTFPELESSLIREFRTGVPRGLYRGYNDSKHVITWHNGSTTRFGHCKNENDVYQYQGAEFVFIGLDELTLFTLRQWTFLTSRNRCSAPGARPSMAGASNPGNIGHAWVKALWMEKKAPAGFEGKYDPRDYEFIPAKISDNPIYANDADYLKTLDALPRALRAAFLEGDWNIFAGQYFDVFDFERHVAPGAELRRPIEEWWPRWISIDWGFEHPCAIYWHAARPDRTVITYREYVQNHLSPRQIGMAIAEQSEGERISEVYCSPDAFAKRTSDDTIADQIGDVLDGAGLPRPAAADDDRVGGWMLMYQLLEDGRWLIADDCERLIECIPTLTRDLDRPEDVLKADGDDPADSARYGLKSRLSPGRMPLEERVNQRVEKLALSDPTSRAIQARRILLEEQKRETPIKRHSSRFWRPMSQQ